MKPHHTVFLLLATVVLIGCAPAPALRPSGAPATTRTAAAPEKKPGLDLLKRIDIGPYTTRGSAHKNEDGLFTDNLKGETAVMIPVRFPSNYELEAQVTRQEGRDCLVLGVQIAGQPCQLIIDGWPDKEFLCGLNMFDGQKPNSDEYRGPLKRGQVFTNNKTSTVVLRVHGEEVELLVDGTLLWKTNVAGHQMRWPDMFSVPDPQGMYVGAYASRFLISKLELHVQDENEVKRLQQLPDLLSADQWELSPPYYDPQRGPIHLPHIVLENRDGALVISTPSPEPILLLQKQELTRSAVARLKVSTSGALAGQPPPLRAIGWLPTLDRPAPPCVAVLPMDAWINPTEPQSLFVRRLGTHIDYAVGGRKIGGRTAEAQHGKIRLALMVQGPGELKIDMCEVLHD